MPAKFESRIPEIVATLPIRVGAALQEGTSAMARQAAERAPVAAETLHFPGGEVPPGTLKRSIEARVGEDGYGIYAAWYYRYPEFGTRYFAAEPFLMPAVEAGIPQTLEKVRAVLVEL